MARTGKILLAILLIAGLVIPLSSCRSTSDEATAAENQVVTVQKGNLTIDITAAGNLTLSRTEDLAFEMAGTVEEVLVQEGDTVEEGQELVRLDTSEWDEQLRTLEKALVTAQRNLNTEESDLTKASRNVAAKEVALAKAERQITAAELEVRQAELDVQTAEDNLNQIAELKAVQDRLDSDESALELVQSIFRGDFTGALTITNAAYWVQLEASLQQAIAQDEKDLEDLRNGTSLTASSDVALEVAKKQLAVEQSQMQLEDAQIAVDDAELAVSDAQFALEEARTAVENAQLDKEDAEQAVEDAQSDLDEAKSLSPIIKATFAGFITKVNVEGGDEILKGTVAAQLADPNKFEAEISVSETDISQVKLEEEASVQVDALSLTLPAQVTRIAPTATNQSGVVSYTVTVEVESLETVMQEQQEAMQNIEQGEIPEQLKQAIEEGSITQEQAEEMIKQRQEAAQQPQTTAAISEDIQLRDGFTVTVSIIVEEKNDILLVPNGAITTRAVQTYVQVMATDGTTEERLIQTGISDWQYTEVISGLTEGEQIVIPEGTTTTSTTTSTTQQGPSGGIMIPGMGEGPSR